jgi:hypothetical protein
MSAYFCYKSRLTTIFSTLYMASCEPARWKQYTPWYFSKIIHTSITQVSCYLVCGPFELYSHKRYIKNKLFCANMTYQHEWPLFKQPKFYWLITKNILFPCNLCLFVSFINSNCEWHRQSNCMGQGQQQMNCTPCERANSYSHELYCEIWGYHSSEDVLW